MKHASILKNASRLGWCASGLLILILITFTIIRTLDLTTGTRPDNLFEARYFDFPVVTFVHMFTGLAFLVFAPLNFSQKFRSRYLPLHRLIGRILLACALVAGVLGILSALVLPVFGGVASETASWFFGLLFLFAISRAYWCARSRQIVLHREWIIRSFALALGVGTQRLVLVICQLTGYATFEETFGPALWLGFTINMVIAEAWINLTRHKSTTTIGRHHDRS
ncbi:MAG: DUF2306 domain-containing protein [Gammaproteobacteria bacterium]|nr:DUF2306 domain-containing protein [Gammaproteobacteria bacterium]